MILKGKENVSTPCEPITDLIGEGLLIVDQLHNELAKSPIDGIGLAANQIGINKSAFVIQIPYGETKIGLSFINPQITLKAGPVVVAEGCLSFPGEKVDTISFDKIFIRDDLEPVARSFTGLAAVCILHEYRHLDGKTMHDFDVSKITRQQNCPCGSSKKFIACCMRKLKRFKDG